MRSSSSLRAVSRMTSVTLPALRSPFRIEQAVTARQHDVEHDEVVFAGAGAGETVVAVVAVLVEAKPCSRNPAQTKSAIFRSSSTSSILHAMPPVVATIAQSRGP